MIPEDGNTNKISIEISEEDVETKIANIVKIDLFDKKCGDKMLKYLFLIITYSSENKIKILKLRNNDIKDASMLARVNFSELRTLDLAVNNIENSDFLIDLKAEKLENLYLDNNYFKNLYPILNVNINTIINSKKLDKVEEKELEQLYKDSEENRSKDVEPLLKAKFKKLKNLSVDNQNVDYDDNNIIPEDNEGKSKKYKLNNQIAFQAESPEY